MPQEPAASQRPQALPRKEAAPVTRRAQPAGALSRLYVVRDGSYVPVWRQPAADAEIVVYHAPGATVLTTGRCHGPFVEVHNARLQPAWMPSASLEPRGDGGWHGDYFEESGGITTLLQRHTELMLKIDLGPSDECLEVQAEADGLVSLIRPGGEFLQGGRPGHRAHVWMPGEYDAGHRRGPLPLLIMLHGSRPLEWDFAEYTGPFREMARDHGLVVLVPESHGPTWDFLLTGLRDDVDFLQSCISELCLRFPIDDRCIAVMGHSDGGSLGLSLAMRNPHVFHAAMVYAAGFFKESTSVPPAAPQPRLRLEYGKHDKLFDYHTVAVPLANRLDELGYSPELVCRDSNGHMAPAAFFSESIERWLESIGRAQAPSQAHWEMPPNIAGKQTLQTSQPRAQ